MSDCCRNPKRIGARQWCILSLALLASLLLATGWVASAQESRGWAEPSNLSQSAMASYYPDVAVDRAGRVYVVWGEYSQIFDGRPDMLMLRIKAGDEWSPANDIAVGGHLPQIAIDSQGRLHLVRIANGLVYKRAWVQDDPLNAQNWGSEYTIAGNDTYWPDLAVDGQDRLHLVFSGGEGISYVRSVDGGDAWTEPVHISLHSDKTDTPRLAIDPSDNLYVVWQILGPSNRAQDPMARAIGFSRSEDGGQTWLPPVEVTAGEGGFEWPQVAADSRGTIHVDWHPRETSSVGYLQSRDGGAKWTPAEILDLPAGGAYSHDLEVDSADNLHLVMPIAVDDLPLNPVHVVRPTYGSWSEPVPIAQNACVGASADVEVVLEKGNHLHAVWYDVEDCLLGWVPPSGRGEVFYSEYVADAPSLAMQPAARQVPSWTVQAGEPPTTTVVPAQSVSTAPTPGPTAVHYSDPVQAKGLRVNGLVMGIGATAAMLAAVAGSVALGRGSRGG